MKIIEDAVLDFVNNEDIDEGNKNLRKVIRTLAELRFAIAIARQKHSDNVDDIIECLIDL